MEVYLCRLRPIDRDENWTSNVSAQCVTEGCQSVLCLYFSLWLGALCVGYWMNTFQFQADQYAHELLQDKVLFGRIVLRYVCIWFPMKLFPMKCSPLAPHQLSLQYSTSKENNIPANPFLTVSDTQCGWILWWKDNTWRVPKPPLIRCTSDRSSYTMDSQWIMNRYMKSNKLQVNERCVMSA